MALTIEEVKQLVHEMAEIDAPEKDDIQNEIDAVSYMIWLLARYVTEVTK